MVHITIPFGLTIDLGDTLLELILTVIGVIIPIDLGVTTVVDFSPLLDLTIDSSWLFDAWNQLVLLYAQSF